jgi:hypothetical protein
MKQKFHLQNYHYASIFIRRGDKLLEESKFIPTHIYVEYLLSKDKNCHTIFLQTDDYRSYLEMVDYIRLKKYNIQVFTMSNPKDQGMIIFSIFKSAIYNTKQKDDYFRQNIIQNTKPIDKYTRDEIKEHVENMLVGIEIVSTSNICVTDYQSNVSRFIKLYHINPNVVYDVRDIHVDYMKFIRPECGF